MERGALLPRSCRLVCVYVDAAGVALQGDVAIVIHADRDIVVYMLSHAAHRVLRSLGGGVSTALYIE